VDPVAYRISFPQPGAHLIHVRLELVAGGEICQLWMPAWSPGSYVIREYARNIRAIAASVGGAAREITKVSKDRFSIRTQPGERVAVDYTIYAHDLSVRTAHHDATHAYLHPPQLFLVPDGYTGPFTVRVELLPGWTAISLAADPARQERHAPGEFAVDLPDLDALFDTPIEAGVLEITALPTPCEHVRLAVWGEPLPAFVLPRLARVVDQVERFWPARPYDRYTFLVHAAVGARGGLEHLAGSVLGVEPDSLAPAARRVEAGDLERDDDSEAGVYDLLELASHELFHAWNVKRLRPRALGPFDYTRENYTRELWIAEGFTSYYDGLLVLRSGEISVKAHLARLAESIGRLRDTPGARVQSLEDSSFDAWIKLYRPQDDSPNASVSYYLKGSLVALLLDLWLRELRPAGPGLDGVMAELWRRGPGRLDTRGPSTENVYLFPGFTIEDIERVLAEQSGLGEVPDAIRALWSRATDLDFGALATVGLRLSEKPVQPGLVELGFTTQDRGGAPWVEFVRTDSPAERAGLAPGDELLAVRRGDGPWVRLRTARAARAWDRLQPGAPAELLVSRRERVLTIPIQFAAARGAVQVERIADAEPTARARFEAWSGRRWSDS
jgi:predicted metalloprotease with PDZ domain